MIRELAPEIPADFAEEAARVQGAQHLRRGLALTHSVATLAEIIAGTIDLPAMGRPSRT
jgi:hypothetical protein